MLKIENLNYCVDENGSKKEILKDINLVFEDEKTYCITGQNGSGKSTFVKIVMGIIKPTSGKIFFDGKDITGMPIEERAKMGISFAFQKPVTFKGLKVKDLLDIASGKKNNVGMLCDYLSKVGLCAKEYINRPLDDKLSGGELKRIELAMAFARQGKLNIFDEPEAGIDLWSFSKLTSLFDEMRSSTNIIVSHQKRILEVADQVILLSGGKVEKIGTFSELEKFIDGKTCKRLEEGENGQH